MSLLCNKLEETRSVVSRMGREREMSKISRRERNVNICALPDFIKYIRLFFKPLIQRSEGDMQILCNEKDGPRAM